MWRSRHECFEHVLCSDVQTMRHASAEPPMSIHESTSERVAHA
jgi:hypothetical protein